MSVAIMTVQANNNNSNNTSNTSNASNNTKMNNNRNKKNGKRKGGNPNHAETTRKKATTTKPTPGPTPASSRNNNKNHKNSSSKKPLSATTGGGPPSNNRNNNNNNNRNKPAATAEEKKVKRQQKKKNRRADQQAAVQKKADAEDQYFRQCQKEALAGRRNNNKNNNNNHQVPKTANELFSKQGAQGINFDKYDSIKVEVKRGGAKVNREKLAFSDYGQLESSLSPTIRRNVGLMNYVKPTPIQKYAIPLALSGDDLMCCAQTGSGKTCAFLLPIIAALDCSDGPSSPASRGGATPGCIVLAPTRELAIQIELEASKLCCGLESVRPVVVYGGANQRQQIRALAYGGDLVVATPGRLTDFVDRGLVLLDQVRFLVLDEADRMLDMGFEPQIRRLVLQSNMTSKEKGRQTLLFSATFPAKIQQLARAFLRDSFAWIAVGRVGSSTDSITQVLVKCCKTKDMQPGDKRNKLQLVVAALQKGPEGRTLIFVQKKRTASWTKKQLSKGGPENGKQEEKFTPILAVEIHGDRSQSQREAALASFRSGECRVLVATDVAARGLDISGVEHVINMDLPVASDDFDSYVHRIGRTGRAGHTGLATSLYVPGSEPKIGNQKIAAQLIRQLQESGQTVEPWLQDEVAGGGGQRKKRNFKRKQ